MDAIEVTRSIELDLQPGELWELIGDGERWADWMVDDVAVDVSPGSMGVVTEGGERRAVRIDEVDEGERVAFEWWPAGRLDESSTVELRIVPARRGTVLEVVETFPAAARLSALAAASAWNARVLGLGSLRRMLVAV
jgi:uncharacterized protein YndB with AHSA1/START domain